MRRYDARVVQAELQSRLSRASSTQRSSISRLNAAILDEQASNSARRSTITPSETPTSNSIEGSRQGGGDGVTMVTKNEISNLCDFESSEMGDLCYFYQEDLEDDFDWTRHSGETPTNDTGPLTDHTLMNDTGHYMYIETTGQRFRDTAILKSVEFFKERTPCYVNFYYHAFGDHVGELLLVFAITDGGTHTTWIVHPSGIHVNEWKHYSRMFDYFGYYTVSFYGRRGKAETGIKGDLGDIAIDDISLSEGCFGE
eukprot:XP_011669222.1 PREDICTED: MAM and LDL-receptor class A domain-containing protein 1-like [Strongylocentrotus purpuratus]